MKRFLSLLAALCCAIIVSPQSIHDLESNPSFKGITIGAPHQQV